MTDLNDLHTFTFTKEDWNLILHALMEMKEDYLAQAREVETSPLTPTNNSSYHEVLRSEANRCEALSNDILLKVL